MDLVDTDIIKKLVLAGKSYEIISEELRKIYPEQRGFSARSVRRYCHDNEINKQSLLGAVHVDNIITKQVAEVGKTYGRKMMRGVLRSKGIKVSEGKVGYSLKRLDPSSQRQRAENAGRSLNPKCYIAKYFGHKVHIDQNEKLVMFGVTHVMARDGFSGMIVSHTTMPIKNNLTIYEEIYQDFTLKYGMWDQLRVDGGKEFVLSCYIQDYLRDHRTNTTIEPYKSTKSTDNNIIERMWVEVNNRVNYPIKSALNQFVADGWFDMAEESTKYAISWVTCRVSTVGVRRFVEAWNHHTVPKKGCPIDLFQRNNKAKPINITIMNKEEAAAHYENVKGRKLTHFSAFGIDPLEDFPDLKMRRENEFFRKCDCETIFNGIQQGNLIPFRYSIQTFITISSAL